MDSFIGRFKGRGNPQTLYAEAISLRIEGGAKYAKKLKQAAAAGSPGANFELGCAIADGTVPGSKADARKHIEEAARLHVPGAKGYLGWSYVTGGLGIKDANKALELLLEAHEEGDARATSNVGYMHLKGLAGEVDAEKAIQYYKLAYEMGDDYAPYNLGALYVEGDHVPVDLVSALEWFEKAHRLGNPKAKHYVDKLKSNLQTHAELAVLAKAAGQPYVPAAPNRERALKNIGKLEDLIGDEDVRQAVLIATVCNQIPVDLVLPLREVVAAADNISYFTGIRTEDIIDAAVHGEIDKLRQFANQMKD